MLVFSSAEILSVVLWHHSFDPPRSTHFILWSQKVLLFVTVSILFSTSCPKITPEGTFAFWTPWNSKCMHFFSTSVRARTISRIIFGGAWKIQLRLHAIMIYLPWSTSSLCTTQKISRFCCRKTKVHYYTSIYCISSVWLGYWSALAAHKQIFP